MIKMRHQCILFDQTDIFGQRIGGAETFLKGVIKYAPENFDISVIGTTIDAVNRPLNRWLRIPFGRREINYMPIVVEGDENYKSSIPLSLRYTLALSRQNLDTKGKILFFNRIEPSILYNSSSCVKIAIIHNDIESQLMRNNNSENLWSKAPFLYKGFERYAIWRIDHVYTVSENSIRYYHDQYPNSKGKFSFLPTWLDPEIFSSSNEDKMDIRRRIVSEQYQVKIKDKWILFVGRLQEQKAPIRLIEVFKRYHDTNRDSVLLVVGDGNLKKQMTEHVLQYGLEKSVIHIKFLKQSQLADFYRAADVLLLVSNYEGMPISVLEALGCGLPVVSTRVGEVPRIIKNGLSGEIIDSFDPTEIATGLEKVIDAPLIYSRKNCVFSVNDFVPEKILEPVFKKMMDLCEIKKKS